MRNQTPVILLVRPIQACLDDPLAERIKLRQQELLQFLSKERAPLPRALFVDVHPALDLLLDRQKDPRNHRAFYAQLVWNISQQRADRLAHLLAGKLRAAPPGQVLARNPLRHKPHLPRPDVLVGQKHIPGLRRLHNLLQQQIRLVHALSGGKCPVGPHALRLHLHALLRLNAGVGVAPRRNQPPQPGQRRAQHMDHGQNAVELAVAVRRWAAHAKAAHIHPLRTVQNVLDHPPRQNHPRIGAQLARRVFHVFPGQAVASGHNVVVQKNQRLRRIDAQPFQIRRCPVSVNVIHAHKPAVLGIGHRQPPARSLILRMRAGHVVGNRPQMAGFRQVQRPLFLGHHVAPQQQPPILHAMDVLGHLALAAATGSLVHQDQLVLIWRYHAHRGAVVGYPALALANLQQNRVDALLGARPRIEVVSEDLLVRALPVMHHHLPPAKMRMPERRRHKQHSARDLESRRNPAARNHPL